MFDKLRDQVREFPNSPGVYVMRNIDRDVLYVGKAISLKKRVSSYFPASKKVFKVNSLLQEVSQIEFIITSSSYEALLLECNFIKKYTPKYNVRLKDSKNYQYLKLTKEEYPALLKVRKVQKDGAQYFGPYTSGKAVIFMVKLLKSTFKLRTCRLKIKEKPDKRGCLLFFINQCSGPCAGKINSDQYASAVKDASLFLRNDYKPLQSRLLEEMKSEARKENYEYAAILRDQLQSIDEIIQKQRVIYPKGSAQDVIAIFSHQKLSCIELFKIREGKIIYEDSFFLENNLEEEDSSILEHFIIQFYLDMSTITPPKEILISDCIEDANSMALSIQEKFQLKSVKISRPIKGDRKKVVDICKENAKKHFEIKYKDQYPIPLDQIKPELMLIQKQFNLPSIPLRIEGYDISNISGINSFGSMVVFINGKPSLPHYRIFKIRHTIGPNDVGMLYEVLTRRLKHKDSKFGALPDLFLIDGGPNQLNSAIKALSETNIKLPVFSLAKKEELLYINPDSAPIQLDKSSTILRLFQHIRDESHRFAKKHFTKLHRKEALAQKNPTK